VRFDVPLVLEGSRLPAALAPGARELSIDLFFRREGKLSASLGIFVHLRRPGHKPVYGDHSAISGQLYLPRMPHGVLARDSFRVALPDRKPSEWEISVGLWDAHAAGERHTILDATAEQRKNAVVIGHVSVP
jgi:hypothetical protein